MSLGQRLTSASDKSAPSQTGDLAITKMGRKSGIPNFDVDASMKVSCVCDSGDLRASDKSDE
jgi:hypothetical protein